MRKIYSCILAGIAAIAAVMPVSAREFLITRADQLSSNASATNDGQGLPALIDGNSETYWHSEYEGLVDEEHYVQVDLGAPLVLADDEDLVVYLQRRHNHKGNHPTIMRIEGSLDGASWSHVAYAFFVYRGVRTKEYSSRIHPSAVYRYLRFTVTANNSRSYNDVGGRHIRFMNMAEFNIIRLGHTENYSDTRIDRFRLVSDYSDFGDMAFERTVGVADSRNRASVPVLQSYLPEGNFDNGGSWTKDLDFWERKEAEGSKLSRPDLSWLTSDNDPDIRPGSGNRQPSNITEHVLYAVPGDAVALYPYYDFNVTTNYYEQYVHWYNYYTGGSDECLDFLIDPSRVVRTDNNGYFGGTAFYDAANRLIFDKVGLSDPVGWVPISTVAEWNAFATRVNNGETRLNGYLVANINGDNRKLEMVSCGTSQNPFRGHFNGFGYAFQNCLFGTLDEAQQKQDVGIFGVVGAGAVLDNFRVYSGVWIYGSDFVGVVGSIEYGESGQVVLRRIVGDHTVHGSGRNASGILGCNKSAGVSVTIEDCAFWGYLIGYSESAAISAWMGDNPENVIRRCYDGTSDSSFVWGIEDTNIFKRGTCTMENCYSRRQGNGLPSFSDNASLAAALGDPWYVGEWNNVYSQDLTYRDLLSTRESFRRSSLIATFFKPRDVYSAEGQLQTLRFPDGRDEFVFACDIAQVFNPANFDYDANRLVEPAIHSRHIFRIRDGKTFADENMSTLEKNRAYIAKTVRYVSAPAGKDFQIRFDSPVPVESSTRSKWYYKANADGTDYRRICSMDVEVYDEKGKLISSDNSMFYPYAEFDGYGTRVIDGDTYYACGGGGKYYRMLRCDSANAVAGKTYIVRLIAKDINNHRIIIPDGSGAELWVQEMHISFLGTANASVVSESTLMTDPAYESRRPGNLQYLGELRDYVNYDEYRELESAENVADPDSYLYRPNPARTTFRYKFPQPWKSVAYTFGYHNDFDFANYNVVNCSEGVSYNGGNYDIYDRLYYDTDHRQKGYFFFINAASDPGVMAKLRLDDFCPGSTVHVSGWYNEFSGGENANLVFNFVAVLDDRHGNQRIPIHTFNSGYVPEVRVWYNIYYSFIPEINHLDAEIFSAIDHYELELDNNCTKSGGADYAIDDIRVYITTPDVQATQTHLVCNDMSVADLKVSTPFEMLMQSLGISAADSGEDNEEMEIYYTFMDKEVYDITFEKTGNKQSAFEESVLRFPYRNSAEPKTYGMLRFNTWYEKHTEYDSAEHSDDMGDVAFREYVGTEKWLTFNTRPQGTQLRPGKEFYVVLYTPLYAGLIPADGPGYKEFDPLDRCSKVSTFRVRTAGQIKVDGKVIPPGAPIEVCEGQSPVVQLDMAAIPALEGVEPPAPDPDRDPEIVVENAYFDWYSGTMDEFLAESYNDEHGNTITLRQMLGILRTEYPDSADLDLVEPKGELTQKSIDFMKALTAVGGDNGEIAPKLRLHASSFVFPPVTIPPGQEMAYCHVLAVPFDFVDDMWLVCSAPTEVSVAVKHHSPKMSHGFAEGIDYPEGLDDVPLRIGLSQLRGVSAAPEWGDNIPEGRLMMPVRDIVPATATVSEMTRGADPLVYLAATDDPQYRDLGIGASGLMPVGEVVALLAKADGVPADNAVQIVFYDTFIFKEGYTYTMRYNFEELAAATMPAGVEDNDVVCKGQDSFTVMVVPEYLKWMGSNGSTNWADDANWFRTSAADLYYKGADGTHDLSDNISDGSNKRVRGFAPLDFSKVLIRKDRVAPELFNAGDRNITVGRENFVWSSQPDGATFRATDAIQYHMAARSQDGTTAVDCRPCLANVCDEVHFGDRGELLGQHELRYSRAHVDVELAPSRWYVLASPLKDIVAGDMYMPTGTARQESELFMPVTFERDHYDRFSPAVFQRSWNRAFAWVHEVPGVSGDDPKTDAFVETTWSGVYNEVSEKYDAGTGFSIKIDGSSVAVAEGGRALMRLPKDDLWYDYYSDDDANVGTRTDVRDEKAGRLNEVDGDIVLSGYREGNLYFMVGNPFMCHMDMVAFLNENSDVIQPKYWLLTADAQTATVMDEISGALVSNAADARYVAPMQGFFVEARNPLAAGGDLRLRYTADMCAVRYNERGPLRKPGSRSAGNTSFTVSAVDDGNNVLSEALIAISSDASAGYCASEDAAAIFDSSLRLPVRVYTMAGDVASSVNITPDAAGTEIGVRMADGEGRYTLRFEGVDNLYDLSLLDTDDGSLTPLREGLEVEVEGDVRGRLFLMRGLPVTDSDLNVSLSERTVTVASTAAVEHIEAAAYDTMGRCICSHSADGPVLDFTLDPGIYIVVASDTNGSVTRKFIVR